MSTNRRKTIPFSLPVEGGHTRIEAGDRADRNLDAQGMLRGVMNANAADLRLSLVEILTACLQVALEVWKVGAGHLQPDAMTGGEVIAGEETLSQPQDRVVEIESASVRIHIDQLESHVSIPHVGGDIQCRIDLTDDRQRRGQGFRAVHQNIVPGFHIALILRNIRAAAPAALQWDWVQRIRNQLVLRCCTRGFAGEAAIVENRSRPRETRKKVRRPGRARQGPAVSFKPPISPHYRRDDPRHFQDIVLFAFQPVLEPFQVQRVVVQPPITDRTLAFRPLG